MPAPSRTIRIRQLSFELTDQFEAGHELSPAEAEALNALRAENIRNSIFKRVQAAAPEAGQEISQPQLQALQAFARRLDSEYQFKTRLQRQQEGQLMSEAREIAFQRVSAQLRQAGTSLAVAEFDAAVAELAATPEVQAQALARVQEGQRLASASLESLLE